MKELEEGNQPNRHLSFFKGIIPSLQNFNEEETLEFQMGVLQLITNIKQRKPSNFSSQPRPVCNQPFHTSSHVGGNNPLLLHASNMNLSLSIPTPNKYGQYSQRQTGASSSTDRNFAVHGPSPSLSVTSNNTDCSIDFTSV
jgi:hypothetical protein